MRVRPLGDSAVLIDGLRSGAAELAAALERQLHGLDVESVPSYDTVGVYFRGPGPHLHKVEEALATLDLRKVESRPKRHFLPVCYELGPDLPDAAAKLGVSIEQVLEAHTSTVYQCFAVGFCPGFPYLGYLRDDIAGLPRLDKPRLKVEPGMVGITGRQTGVYPLQVPGGWNLIARTPLTIVDVNDGYFPIAAGDEVAFGRIDEGEFERLAGERL